MNCELKFLREIPLCRKHLFCLKKDILQQALKSFSAAEVSGGTYRQILQVAEAVAERDRLEEFLFESRKLFRFLPKGYRALLFKVYVQGVPCEEIARMFGVSLSTVYRKLERARLSLKNLFKRLSENAFPEVFSLLKEEQLETAD